MLKKQYYKIKDDILYYFSEFKKLLLPIGILSVLYVFSYSAILRANFNYIDDMGRVFQGNKGWEYYSRFLSNFLSRFFSTGNYLTDVSPLTQIVASIFLAAAGAVAVYALSGKTKFSFWQYVAALFFGLTPFFLECISYKYDSPYMALSILASVLPLFFFREKNYIFYGLTVFAGILAMCMTYQAGSGIFPIFVMLLAFKMWNEDKKTKDILRFLGTSALGYIISLLFFRLFVMVPAENYASTSLPAFSEIFSQIATNFSIYFNSIKNSFRTEWLVMIILVCVAFIYVGVRDSKRKKYISLVVSLVTIAAMFFMSLGVYLILENPLFANRAMYEFGAFIALIAITVASAKKIYWAKLVSFALCWVFVVFSFSYGNALYVQKTYTDYRITMTIDDIMDLELLEGEETKYVQITGSIGHAPAIRNMPEDNVMLRSLVPAAYGNSGWYWGRYGFEHYYNLKNIVFDVTIDLTTYDLPVLLDNQYHTIRSDGKHILIEVKE